MSTRNKKRIHAALKVCDKCCGEVNCRPIKLNEVRRFAEHKHSGQVCDEGRSYVKHLYQVADILMYVTGDIDVIAAGYLHDTLEDTDTTYNELVERFGKRVADLVNEVTHDGTNDNYGYYFPRLKSKEAIMIKFADRLSNFARMGAWNAKRIDHYLRRSKFWKDGSDLNLREQYDGTRSYNR